MIYGGSQLRAIRSVALGAIVQQVLSLALVVMSTRWLGTEGYGKIVTLVALIVTLFNLSSQWIQPYTLRESSVRFANSGRMSGEFFIPLGISLILLTITTWFGSWFGDDSLPAFRNHSLFDIMIAALGYALVQSARIACQIRQRFDLYGRLLILDKFLIFLIYAVIFGFGGMTAELAVRIYALCGLFAGLFGMWWSTRRMIDFVTGGFNTLAFIRSGGAIVAAIWLNNVASINFLTANALGKDAAWLGAGGVVLGFVLQPFGWIQTAISPQLSVDALKEDGPGRIKHYLSGKVCFLVLIAILLTALAAGLIIKTNFFVFTFGDEFREGKRLAAILVTMAPAEVANMLVIRAYYALSKERILVFAMAIKMAPFGIALWVGLRSEVLVFTLILSTWFYVVVLVSLICGGTRNSVFTRHLGCSLLGLILSTTVWYGAGG